MSDPDAEALEESMPNDKVGVGVWPSVRLSVRLLGAVEVILDGRRLRAFNALRLQRLLARIALWGGPQHRSRLAFELWPDSDERQARTNLRKLLHECRQSLPDIDQFVEIDPEAIRWIGAASSQVDVLRFQDAITGGNLQLAARLYAGDLLPACYDDWTLDQRRRIRAAAHGVLAALTDEAVERRDHEATVSYAHRVLDLVPTDEGAARAQIEAYRALGDRAAALRSYHRVAEVLKRDLDIEPGEALTAAYRRVRAGFSGSDAPGSLALPQVGEAPFVGRDVEWSQVTEIWNDTLGGRAHVVLVTGEPGIGKSRLAAELGRHVRGGGHAVASARAYEAAGRPPWGPIVELLRSDALGTHIQALDPVWRTELGRLLPELGASVNSSPGPAGDGARRHRLLDAVGRALVGAGRPLMLIVDDLQWCDVETIETLGFVIRSRAEAKLLIVGTVRWGEVPDGHPLPALADALDRDRAVTRVPLDRLDEPTTAALAAGIRPDDAIAPELAARLWTETEGNPLFVVEALRAGISIAADQRVLTPTMRAVLRARLGQISDRARRLTEAAAVIGRPFSVGLLASSLGMSEPELVDPLDELWRRRILRDRGRTYDFSHDKLRTVALELMSPARRRRLHRDVAEATTAESGDDPDAAAPRLAAHYDQAGMVESAISAYRRAGERAVAVSALDEAVRMFRRGLALLGELPASSARDTLEVDLRIALGSPLVALAGYGSAEAHELYERAHRLCLDLRRPVDPPILRGLGLARLQGCRIDECRDLGQALVDHASRDPVAITEGQYLLGVSGFWAGDLATARRHLTAGIAGYDTSRTEEHLAWYAQDPKAVCMVRLALVELWAGDPGRADELAHFALNLATELDHPMTAGYVLTYAAIQAAESGDLVRLGELLTDAEQLWQRLSDRYLIVVLEALRGWSEIVEGTVGGLERILGSVVASRAQGETLHLTYTLLLLARAYAAVGHFQEGRAAAEEGLSWGEDHNQRYLDAELRRVAGEVAYRSGEAAAAGPLLGSAVEIATRQGARWLELRALHTLASRFPDPALNQRLSTLVDSIPSGRELPPFQAALRFARETR